MASKYDYVSKVPHGLGISISQELQKMSPASYIWRLFSKPLYWIDGGYSLRGTDSYIPTLPLPEWSPEAEALHASLKPNEFWLVGQDSQDVTHPTDAATFSNEWSDGIVALPGIRIDTSGRGLAWLDEYMDVGGIVPHAWHVHIVAPWTEWLELYGGFLAWMKKRRVLRPVVVTGVEAGTLHRAPQVEFIEKMVGEGLMRQHFLSALIWSDVYDSHRWGASMVQYSMRPTLMGHAWVRAQKEFHHAISSSSSRPAWDLLGDGNRNGDTRPLRRRLSGKGDAGAHN